MRQGLSELAHEYTVMGVLGPIQLIGRRRGECLLVQDTVTRPSILATVGPGEPSGSGAGHLILSALLSHSWPRRDF